MRYCCLIVLLLLMVACQKAAPKVEFDDLPDGDATRGAELFNTSLEGLASCASCHRLDDQQLTGPGLGGYATRAAQRVSGQSAAEYTYTSIVRPARYLVSGFSNVMVQDYGQKLAAQDLSDLIAYLLTLKES